MKANKRKISIVKNRNVGNTRSEEKTVPAGVFKIGVFFKTYANDGASFLCLARSPPQHEMPAGTMLPRSPALLEQMLVRGR
jgi:hypothetical protein